MELSLKRLLQRKWRARTDHGQALLPVLAALIIAVSIGLTVTLSVITNVTRNAHNTFNLQASAAAQSGVDYLISQIEQNPCYLLYTTTSSGTTTSTSACASQSTASTKDVSAPSGGWATDLSNGKWATFASSGQLETCPASLTNPTQSCFELTAAPECQYFSEIGNTTTTQGTATGGTYTNTTPVSCAQALNSSSADKVVISQITITAAGMAGCSSWPNCPQVTYQTHLTNQSYLNYLYFTQYETLAPNIYPKSILTACGVGTSNSCQSVQYVNGSSDSSGASTASTLHLSTQSVTTGDLLMVTLVADGQGSATPTFTAPSGWTLYNSYSYSGTFLSVYYMIGTNADSNTSYNFSISGTAHNYTSFTGQLFDISGENKSSPFDGFAGVGGTATSGMTFPTINTTANNDMIIYLGGSDAAFSTPPSTTPMENSGTAWWEYLSSFYGNQATAGTTPSGETTTVSNGASGAAGVAVTLAIQPTPAPTVTPAAWSTGCDTSVMTSPFSPATGCIYPAYFDNNGSGTLCNSANGSCNDTIGGAIHTNSDWLFICGTSTGTTADTLPGEGQLQTSNPTTNAAALVPPGCTSDNGATNYPPSATYTVKQVANVALPTPDQLNTLQGIAQLGTTLPSATAGSYYSGTNIGITGTQNSSGTYGLDICTLAAAPTTSNTQPCSAAPTFTALPSTGVIYTTNNVQVSGVFAGQLTIVSQDNVIVTGNTNYNCPTNSNGTLQNGCTSLLGLIAQGDIVYNDPGTSSSPGFANGSNLTVDAAEIAMGAQTTSGTTTYGCTSAAVGGDPQCGSIYDAQWDCPIDGPTSNTVITSPSTGAPCGYLSASGTFVYPDANPSCSNNTCNLPTLIFNGAMVSEYRGAFGAYNYGGSILTTGYYKQFAWDQRLLNEQPPWFIQPSSSSWIETGLQQLHCPYMSTSTTTTTNTSNSSAQNAC